MNYILIDGMVYLNAMEVCSRIHVSVQTLNLWYKFKQQNPDEERAQMLPDYVRNGNRRTRYWKEDDLHKLYEFKMTIPQGKRGVMGGVTQKYVYRNGPEDKYIEKTVNLLRKNNVDADVIDLVAEFLKDEYENRKAS